VFEEAKEKLAIGAADLIMRERDRNHLVRLFLFGTVGNALVWLLALFSPVFIGDLINTAIDLEDRVMLYLEIVPFVSGFVMVYPLCKLRKLKMRKPESAENEFLDGYFESSHNDRNRNVFLVSAMAGGANAILLTCAVIWFR
jgi:hypothetical protein